MNIKEIVELIKIREYMASCPEFRHVERSVANKITKILPKVDKRITDILDSQEFDDLLSGKIKDEEFKIDDLKREVKTVTTHHTFINSSFDEKPVTEKENNLHLVQDVEEQEAKEEVEKPKKIKNALVKRKNEVKSE